VSWADKQPAVGLLEGYQLEGGGSGGGLKVLASCAGVDGVIRESRRRGLAGADAAVGAVVRGRTCLQGRQRSQDAARGTDGRRIGWMKRRECTGVVLGDGGGSIW
jgi:hypothetical protein